MSNEDSFDRAGSVRANGGRMVAEGPVLVHIWKMLDPERADTAVQHLDEMLSQVATEPGFVSAKVLESADGHSIAAVIEMRTAEDRQRLQQLPVVGDALAHLEGTMNTVITLYHEREKYRPRAASA